MLLQLSHFCPFTQLHPAHPLPPTFPPIVHVHESSIQYIKKRNYQYSNLRYLKAGSAFPIFLPKEGINHHFAS